jgi:hypothetical protein
VKRISIGGVVELERNIKEQEQRTESLERQIALMASATANAAMHFHMFNTWQSGEQVHKPTESEYEAKTKQVWTAAENAEGGTNGQS